MSFSEELNTHIEKIRSRLPHIKGEEATKQALVIPLLQVLGYDVFDPREVKPEYVADFAVKKGGQFEKIDYAIFMNGSPAIFIECKPLGSSLEDHNGQLSRYFNSAPSVKVAVITDGVKLRVFTDLQQPNIMDPNPWLNLDLNALKPAEIDALRHFRKVDFSASDILALAEEMMYYNKFLSFVSSQLREPNENFVRFVAGEISEGGRITSKVVERLSPILRKALQSAIVDQVAKSLEPSVVPTSHLKDSVQKSETKNQITTTQDELLAYEMIVSFIAEAYADAQISYRDSKNFFMIHQNNTHKWFLRMWVQEKPMWIAFRHVTNEELSQQGFSILNPSDYGDGRVSLSEIKDLEKLKTFLQLSYDREQKRVD